MRRMMVRADGNFNIGLGHIIRCMSLMTMLRERFDITFVVKEPEPDLVKIISAGGFKARTIQTEESFLRDLRGNEIVVLDGYHFDTSYQRRVKEAGVVLVCIDDLHQIHFVADVIINHAPGISKDQYDAASDTEFCLGPEFALLRPAFLQQALKTREIGKIKKALICFGGSDSKNLTIPVLQMVSGHAEFQSIIVITGSAYAFNNDLKKAISKNERIIHHHNIGEQDIINDLLDVELAVVPASGILFEVIACKTPVISGYYVDNQRGIYEGFLDQEVFFDAGDFEKDRLKNALDQALTSDHHIQLQKQTACIDGRSAERYRDIFNRLTP